MVENSVRCCVVNGSLGEVAGQLVQKHQNLSMLHSNEYLH